VLFAATGAVLGVQALQAIFSVAWGRDPHPSEVAALLGGVGLLVAAAASPARPRGAAGLALASALVAWPLYGWAVVEAATRAVPLAVDSLLLRGLRALNALVTIGPPLGLLLATTWLAGMTLRASPHRT
jgi:hypothetical protein